MDTDPRTATADTDAAYREQVRAYYDATNAAYLTHLGPTLQAMAVVGADGREDTTASNLYLASQAGIQPGQRILDAGCGVCGPAVDIARAIDGVVIDAITISPVQARSAWERIEEAGLAGRVRVCIGDYHYLPFPSKDFDIVFFFESSGYSYARPQLFSETYRVLRSGGRLYIKDIFKRDGDLSDCERQELALFDRIYAHRTPAFSQTAKEIAQVGFQDVQPCDLTSIVGQRHWGQAMGEFGYRVPQLTALGELHFYPFECLPVFCGEVKARKPG